MGLQPGAGNLQNLGRDTFQPQAFSLVAFVICASFCPVEVGCSRRANSPPESSEELTLPSISASQVQIPRRKIVIGQGCRSPIVNTWLPEQPIWGEMGWAGGEKFSRKWFVGWALSTTHLSCLILLKKAVQYGHKTVVAELFYDIWLLLKGWIHICILEWPIKDTFLRN